MAETKVAVDVGGTFTDVVTLDDGQLRFDKVPTTPTDPQRGVLDGFAASGVSPVDAAGFVHGTTLGLNALLTRTGARTGIITTAGFRDVYLLGRTARTPMYDIRYRKPESLVERFDILEVQERLDWTGSVVTEFDEDGARSVAREVASRGIQAVAICFLHSYVNPDHEQRMATILREEAPEIEVTVSSDLSRELREYERTSTSVLDAYIKPIVRRYLARLEDELADMGFAGQFLVTRSGGGALTVTAAKDAPANLILSGPAGGVLGAAWFAKKVDYPNLITIDMGGTSLDASLVVDGEPLRHFEASFENLPMTLSSLYIHTIGAGGGSLVWLDEGGALQVGPGSAGADPGPAAYGRGGTSATFTDAALHTGYLSDEIALAGTLVLDKELAAKALRPHAEALGMTLDQLARGVLQISTTKIVGAVRAITVELGHNPADFGLLAFGGGGGLVAVDVARELSIPTVVVPPGPGAFSAFGMLMADVQHDDARTRIGPLDDLDLDVVNTDLDEMLAEGRAALLTDGFSDDAMEFRFAADLRYVGQEHSVTLPIGGAIDAGERERMAAAFAEAHERQYGHTMPDPVELVALRLQSIGRAEPPSLPTLPERDASPLEPVRTQAVVQPSGGSRPYALYHRDDLRRGDELDGPAIIAEHTATTVLHAGDTAVVGAHGEIVITVSTTRKV